jgi:hypothetical protein
VRGNASILLGTDSESAKRTNRARDKERNRKRDRGAAPLACWKQTRRVNVTSSQSKRDRERVIEEEKEKRED